MFLSLSVCVGLSKHALFVEVFYTSVLAFQFKFALPIKWISVGEVAKLAKKIPLF